MKAEDTWLSSLVDGHLTDEETDHLVDCMVEDPKLLVRVKSELEISDHLSRALDPRRSDAAFLSCISVMLNDLSGPDAGDQGHGDIPDTDEPPAPSSGGGAGGLLSGPAKKALLSLVSLTAAVGVYLVANRWPTPAAQPTARPLELSASYSYFCTPPKHKACGAKLQWLRKDIPSNMRHARLRVKAIDAKYMPNKIKVDIEDGNARYTAIVSDTNAPDTEDTMVWLPAKEDAYRELEVTAMIRQAIDHKEERSYARDHVSLDIRVPARHHARGTDNYALRWQAKLIIEYE